jgi:hypothetical protein
MLANDLSVRDWVSQAARDCSLGDVIVLGSLIWGMIEAGPSGRVESQWYDTGFVCEGVYQSGWMGLDASPEKWQAKSSLNHRRRLANQLEKMAEGFSGVDKQHSVLSGLGKANSSGAGLVGLWRLGFQETWFSVGNRGCFSVKSLPSRYFLPIG